MARPHYTPEQRAASFWSRVDRNGPIPDYAPHLGACWLWTRSQNRGYGAVHDKQINGKRNAIPAHRMAWMLEIGPLTVNQPLDHLCRVKLCVRPSHLEQVDTVTNLKRMHQAVQFKGRPYQKKPSCPRGHSDWKDTNVGPTGLQNRRCRTCQQEWYQARKLSL